MLQMKMREEMLDLKAIAAHAGNMPLYQLFALLICNCWVVLQKAIVTGRFCFWASTTSKRRSVASEIIERIRLSSASYCVRLETLGIQWVYFANRI